MAFPKKGTRQIEVDGILYHYKISKVKHKSDWRAEENELNEEFMKYASYYGLGEVKDATINIAVQLAEQPVSGLFVKIHTLIVNGFMGPEQIIEITPFMVTKLIRKGLKEGWNSSGKGDYRIVLAQKSTKERTPVILQLPSMNEGADSYKNLEKPVEIELF